MASTVNIVVALSELAHAEYEVRVAQMSLASLQALGGATDDDRTKFGELAARLLASETDLYGKIITALRTLPDDVSAPVIARIPVPTPLVAPGSPSASGASTASKNPALPVWAIVVIVVLLALVVAVAVVWSLEITTDAVTNIILTFRQAALYNEGLQARIQCVQACRAKGASQADCAASCAQLLPLPQAPHPPAPLEPPNPNLPWYIGGAVAAVLGLAGIAGFFLDRGSQRRAVHRPSSSSTSSGGTKGLYGLRGHEDARQTVFPVKDFRPRADGGLDVRRRARRTR